MSDNSQIEWTDATWNPIRARNTKTGKLGWHCEHATTGCEFCYAEGFNKRLGTGLAFKPGHRQDIEIFLDETMLTQPLRWKRPRMIFVCSMTDLFADFVEDRWLDRMFAVMGACEEKGLGHTFQILTKRPARMLAWMNEHGHKSWNSCRLSTEAWPARNVWLGVSAERQQEADERIPLLLSSPAVVRFISAEPLLDSIDLRWIAEPDDEADGVIDALGGFNWIEGPGSLAPYRPARPEHTDRLMSRQIVKERPSRLDWVIAGGESGPNARPMHPDWARGMRDQCAAAGVPFFFKQWGQWIPGAQAAHITDADLAKYTVQAVISEGRGNFCFKVGKKAAGRNLDGKLHNAMPEHAR